MCFSFGLPCKGGLAVQEALASLKIPPQFLQWGKRYTFLKLQVRQPRTGAAGEEAISLPPPKDDGTNSDFTAHPALASYQSAANMFIL